MDQRYSRKAFLRRGTAGAALLAGGGSLMAACGGDGSPEASHLELLNWHTATRDAGLGKGFIDAGKAYRKRNDKQSVAFRAQPFADYVAAATTACRARKLASNLVLLPARNHAKLFGCVRHVTDAGDLRGQLTGWDAAAVEPGRDGEYAGYPVGGQGTVWYYNRSLFERAGLDPDKPPSTFDDFATACERLKREGIDPIGISGADSYTPWWMWHGWSAQLIPTPGEVNAFAQGRSRFDQPGVVESLRTVRETHEQSWWGKGFKDKKFSDTEADFVDGKVAMVCGIVTDIMSWSVWDAKMGKSAYGVFAAPLLEGAKSSGPGMQGFSIAFISAVSASASGAADGFARFLASKPAQTILLRDAGEFPNRKDIDILAVTGSKGAARISDILARHPTVDVVFNWLNAAASAAALPKVTSAVVDGDLEGYVADVSRLQAQDA